VRPVNLLPAQHRSRVATGQRSGSAYVVLGLLGLVLVAAGVYVVVANQVTARQDEAARLAAEASVVEQEAAELAPFGSFQALKFARLSSVSSIAQSRIDWERLTRELALLMPRDAWLSDLTAGMSAESTTSTTEEGSTTATGEEAATGPTVTLVGCAKSQPTVARMLVHLRRLHGAQDVTLNESARSETEATGTATGGTSTGATSTGTTSPGSTSGGDECGRYFSFDATVALAPPATVAEPQALEGEKVPVSLGGGP
jgi:Tfp pilus assembly protein PilN